jgi:hypothetical protein
MASRMIRRGSYRGSVVARPVAELSVWVSAHRGST